MEIKTRIDQINQWGFNNRDSWVITRSHLICGFLSENFDLSKISSVMFSIGISIGIVMKKVVVILIWCLRILRDGGGRHSLLDPFRYCPLITLYGTECFNNKLDPRPVKLHSLYYFLQKGQECRTSD